MNHMNQTSQKSILCYGDSNTWGYVPLADHTLTKVRYPRSIRWTGLLQTLLGDEFYVIEEGLNSRTTNVDYAVPPDRNGKTYLGPCLYSHAPLDLVILALGGNDTKTYFKRTAKQIKNGLAELVDIIKISPYGSDMVRAPQILIMTSALPYPFIEEVEDENGIKFMQGALQKSHELIDLYAQLAEEKACHFIDLSKDIIPSKIDGVHFDELAHKKCAEMLYVKIKNIFAQNITGSVFLTR